jgi:UDP-glucose 4-epimerase
MGDRILPARMSARARAATPDAPVLVCGGAGYIGSHTVRALETRGLPVVVLDNLSTGHLDAVGAQLERVDLGDPKGLAAVFARHRPQSVIHFAAKCYVGESVENPSKYYRENVFYTWNLLEAMRVASCRNIVFSSTAATYGEPEALPITEDHPQRPINPYGRTKLAMEHMMKDYARAYGLHIAALRYFNAAGAARDGDLGEDHEPETHLIPRVFAVALGGAREVAIFGDDYDTPDGTCVRDYIHVEDLADAHVAALAALERGTQEIVLNLGTGRGWSVKELVLLAREVTGHPLPVRVAPRREGDPARLVADGSRARDVLGWTPARSDLRTILEDAWRFHRAHPRGFAKREHAAS